jgi:hypothetical protein
VLLTEEFPFLSGMRGFSMDRPCVEPTHGRCRTYRTWAFSSGSEVDV